MSFLGLPDIQIGPRIVIPDFPTIIPPILDFPPITIPPIPSIDQIVHDLDNAASKGLNELKVATEKAFSDAFDVVRDAAGDIVKTTQDGIQAEINIANSVIDSITGINIVADIHQAQDDIQTFVDAQKDSLVTVGADLLAVGMTSIGVPAPLAFALATLAADAIKNDGKINAETVGAVLGSALGGPIAGAFSVDIVQSFETGKIDLSKYAATAAGAITPGLEAELSSQLTNGLESALGNHVGAAFADALSSVAINALHQVQATGEIDISALANGLAQHEVAGATNIVAGVAADAKSWAAGKIAAITYDISGATGVDIADYVARATTAAEAFRTSIADLSAVAVTVTGALIKNPGQTTSQILKNNVADVNINVSGRTLLIGEADHALAPFTNLVVSDPVSASSMVATISAYRDQAVTNSADVHYGKIDDTVGTLTGVGIIKIGPGVYKISATSAKDMTAALHDLSFAPSEPGTLVDLTMSVADTTGHLAIEQSAAFLTIGGTAPQAPQTNLLLPSNVSFSIAALDAVKADGTSGTTPYTFSVSRTGDSSQAATLSYSVSGTGTNPALPALFTNPTGTVSFAAGASVATATLNASAAAITADEGFTLTLGTGTGPNAASTTSIATASASGTVLHNVAPTSYSIAATADSSKADGTSGTTPYTFSVSRTGDSSQAATLSYVAVGTGSNPAPEYLFANASGSVSFAAGASTATLEVNINAAAVRSSKDFTVTLAAPAGATLAQATVTGTVGVNTTGTPPSNAVVLTGTHDQYVIAATLNGKAYIQDLVAGRDGTQTVANPGEILFADGTGLFDATGNAEAMTRLYQAGFGRAPDAPGLEYAVPLINQGSLSLRQVADGFLTSPEYQRQYGNLDTVTLVQEMYQNVLHRAVNPSDPLDVAGVQNFSNLANSQGRGAALLALSDSQENHRLTIGIAGDKTDAQAARLYQAAFNRAPDAPGLQAVTNALKSGVSAEQVAQGFVGSGEFQRAYGTQSNSDFVTGLYRNVLHREADAGGKAQYTMALDAGYSRGFALASIADSDENRVRIAPATHDAWVFIRT